MDSDSTYTVFCNTKYVSNIQDSDNPLSINTNGGLMKLHHNCDIPYINDLWYNKNYIKNNISRKYMTEKISIMMDSKEELTFSVHMPNEIVKFKQFYKWIICYG